MNQLDVLDDVFYLVCLQMSDEMPIDIFWQHFMFVAHLKSVILTKNTLSGIVSLLKIFNRFGLRHRNKQNTRRYCFSYCFQIFLYHDDKVFKTMQRY